MFHTFWGAVIFVPLLLIKALIWAALFGLSKNRPLTRVGLWVVMEYLTSLGDLAFPWGFVGYALGDAPGRILASMGGVYGLSLLVLLVAYGGYIGWKRFEQNLEVFSPYGLGLVGLIVGWLILWAIPLPPVQAGDTTALLVQGNINPITRDWSQAPKVYLELTRQGLAQFPQAKVVAWPESAVVDFPPQIVAFPPELDRLLGDREHISGTFVGNANSAVRRVNGQMLEYYSKIRLVPFGEHFPWEQQLEPLYRFFTNAFGLGNLSSETPGSSYRLLGRYGAFICYESVFPSVTRTLVARGAQVLELGSNDAWYGPSFGGLQHFKMGRLRAVETGRWLLRAGNDGVTAIIDPLGRVINRIPQYQAGYLAGSFAYLQNQTLYVRFGDWAVGLAGLLAAIGLLFRPRPSIV